MENSIERYLKPKEVIHHIDENKSNNNLNNLLLCDNESQHRTLHRKEHPKRICLLCNKTFIVKERAKTRYSAIKYCSTECSKIAQRSQASKKANNRSSNKPSKEELEQLIWKKPTSALSKDFGVSDKAIEKWCKKYDIPKPPRGYWTKKKYNKL